MGKGQLRHVRKTDANQKEIMDALRELSFVTVESLHKVGGGVPDLLVALGGANYLIEVKTEKGKLEPSQVAWHRNWKGPVYVFTSGKQAQDWALSMRSQGVENVPYRGVVT